MKSRVFSGFAVLALLAACAPAPISQPVAPVVAPADSAVPVTDLAGLESREPDLCHAKDWVGYLSQPATVIPTLNLGRPYRIVQWRGIEPQDYNPQRIVFRLDAGGNIYNIDCG